MDNLSEPELLERANHAFEYAWSFVFGLFEENHMDSQIQLAARRLLSYNPQHRVVEEKMPLLYGAVNTLCSIIKARINDLAQAETVENWTILLFCYLLMNDMPNAYTTAAHALRLQPDISDPYFNYCAGIVYQHFHYYEDAIKFYKKPSDRFEQNIDRNFRLAIAYRSQAKYNESESLLRNLLKHPPANLKANDIKFQLAYTLQLNDRNKEAANLYEELYSQNPRCHELIQQYVWFLSFQDDSKSLSRAEEIIGDSTDSTLRFASARISMKLRDYNAAYLRYRDCTSSWSESPLFWCGLGVLYLRNEQYPDSILAFQRALYLKNDIPEAWLNLGLIYEIQGESPNAMKIYQTAQSNCENAKIVNKRIAECEIPSRHSCPKEKLLKEILEIDGKRLFEQPIERYSEILVSYPPILSESCFNNDKSIQPQLVHLIQPYPSLFD
ncbi:hypothetical protein M9Y10_011917 [Tritrichomonas musculus]|uniref:TPR Domain containing protein n=1 Tax=Tritrichomonas musculus TaxID=1915356 RepID=A0ABR2IB81_9EUKA